MFVVRCCDIRADIFQNACPVAPKLNNLLFNIIKKWGQVRGQVGGNGASWGQVVRIGKPTCPNVSC